MTNCSAPKLLPTTEPSETLSLVKTHLTRKQFECLSRCAAGISLRFEAWEIVNALIASGHVEQRVAGVVSITLKGKAYLRTHTS